MKLKKILHHQFIWSHKVNKMKICILSQIAMYAVSAGALPNAEVLSEKQEYELNKRIEAPITYCRCTRYNASFGTKYHLKLFVEDALSGELYGSRVLDSYTKSVEECLKLASTTVQCNKNAVQVE